MQKSNVCRSGIFRKNTEILRVLEIRENKALVIDCAKSRLPWWISLLDLKDAVEITEEDLLEEMGVCLSENISGVASKVMHERFHMIARILPFVGEKKKRSYLIEETTIRYEVSVNTVKNYLISYLACQRVLQNISQTDCCNFLQIILNRIMEQSVLLLCTTIKEKPIITFI